MYWPALARTGELVERRLRADTDTRPLVVARPARRAPTRSLDAAVRGRGLAVRASRARGRLRAAAARRPAADRARADARRRGTHAHARLAVVADGAAPPLAGMASRRGTVFYVAAAVARRAHRARCRTRPAAAACSSCPAPCPAGGRCSRWRAAPPTSSAAGTAPRRWRDGRRRRPPRARLARAAGRARRWPPPASRGSSASSRWRCSPRCTGPTCSSPSARSGMLVARRRRDAAPAARLLLAAPRLDGRARRRRAARGRRSPCSSSRSSPRASRCDCSSPTRWDELADGHRSGRVARCPRSASPTAAPTNGCAAPSWPAARRSPGSPRCSPSGRARGRAGSRSSASRSLPPSRSARCTRSRSSSTTPTRRS